MHTIAIANQDRAQLKSWSHTVLNWLAQDGVQLHAIPTLDPNAIHILPVSGGADSTALCLLMHMLYPNINFTILMSDTGAEPLSVYQNLEALSKVLGKPITIIQGKRTLWEQIDHHNGFLPSARDRWCTRTLKLEPFKAWMKELRTKAYAENREMIAYVGIRADESSRVAFNVEGLTTSLPYIDMGIRREHVFRLLSMTVGIPSTYRTRTRSGCEVCPFMRRAEVVGMLTANPAAFAKGEAYERLSAEDAQRYGVLAEPIWRETRLGSNHVTYPIPPQIDLRTAKTATQPKMGKVTRSNNLDLFGEMVGLWVGVEFLVHPMLEGSGVWMQRMVTYSRNKAQLTRQLDMHYQHRLSTAETDFDSQDDARAEIKYGIFYITIDAALLSTTRPTAGESYTWRSGEAYAQVRHIMSWVNRTLGAEMLRNEVRDYEGKRGGWAQEHLAAIKPALAKIEQSGGIGEVVFQGKYDASEIENLDDVLDETTIPCPLCMV